MTFADFLPAAAIVISLLSVIFAGGSYRQAKIANRDAQAVNEESKRAAHRSLWTEAIGAVQELVGASTVATDMHPLMVRARTAFTELCDASEDDEIGDAIGELDCRGVLGQWALL